MSQSNKDSKELSLKDIVLKTKSAIRYYKLKWLTISITAVSFGLLGIVISFLADKKYTATCTFVLQDASKGALSQYAGLASLAGMDVSGGGASDIFQGDNIIQLYQSRLMIEKALLQQANFNGKSEMLIDRYIDYNKLRQRWKKKDIDTINFIGDPEKFTRRQDSIITDIVNNINDKILDVEKLDKKLSIITVQVTFGDELFAQQFTNTIVATVNDFYIQTTTKKTYQNIVILQHQADSVKGVLNTSISGVANDIDAVPNANPDLLSLKVPSQKHQVDVQASGDIYAEIVKNLELTKISFLQEMPLIQIIDKPVLPLPEKHLGKIKGFILGLLLGGFSVLIYLTINKFYRNLMKQ